MNKNPRYFVAKIDGDNCTNKAQDCVDNQLRGLLYRTINDAGELSDFENKMRNILDRAHELYPRCKKMEMEKSRYTLGGVMYNFTSGSRTYNSFTRVLVIEIRGDWKGGLHD